jgi:hypothetical protein
VPHRPEHAELAVRTIEPPGVVLLQHPGAGVAERNATSTGFAPASSANVAPVCRSWPNRNPSRAARASAGLLQSTCAHVCAWVGEGPDQRPTPYRLRVGDFLAVLFLADVFRVGDFLAVLFLAEVFRVGDFLAVLFLAEVFRLGDFLAVLFLAEVLPEDSFAGDFLVEVDFADDFLAFCLRSRASAVAPTAAPSAAAPVAASRGFCATALATFFAPDPNSDAPSPAFFAPDPASDAASPALSTTVEILSFT